jgi:hypothetical protein
VGRSLPGWESLTRVWCYSTRLGSLLCFLHTFDETLFGIMPFQYFVKITPGIDKLREAHAFVALFGPVVVGSIALVQRNVVIGTFYCV